MMKWMMDTVPLVTAYLAEHPADDDEPITERWLLSIGVQHAENTRYVLSQGKYERIWLYFWETGINAELAGGGEIVFATRGDVRRLCAALGIDLNQPKGNPCDT